MPLTAQLMQSHNFDHFVFADSEDIFSISENKLDHTNIRNSKEIS